MAVHGSLDTSHVLLDRLGMIWLPDLSATDCKAPFTDAAHLVASILFEHLVPPDQGDSLADEKGEHHGEWGAYFAS